MELDIKTLGFVMTQVALITTVIASNKHNVRSLKETNEKLEKCLKELSEKVTELRIKVGV